jgi:AraC-like DNA-binding protein
MAPFHINKIIPHQLDQLFNVAHTYFYSISLWVLLERYRKTKNNPIKKVPQYKLIKKWLLLFTGIFSVITINFTVAMANMWLYDDKSVFLDRASGALLFASIVYVMLNTMVMFFPHIMYGLPFDHRNLAGNDAKVSGSPAKIKGDLEENPSAADVQKPSSSKIESQLFSPDYVLAIEELLEQSIEKQTYLQLDCGLSKISDEIAIPAHHLTYYFNNIKKESFSNWRNNLRIAYAIRILSDDTFKQLTIEGIGEKVGFKSYSTFIRSFKKVTGKTPSDYMENRS